MLSTLKNKYAVIVTVLLIILGIVVFYQHKAVQLAKKKQAVAEHNLAAANDTIRVTKAKNGQIEYDKLSFLAVEIDDLKKANAELYAEIKNTQGKVNTIIKTNTQIIHDTVSLIVKGELIDSTVTADFSFDTIYSEGNFRKLQGYTKYDMRTGKSLGKLNEDKIGIGLVTGIRNLDKGKPEIFIRSLYPNFEITKLEGAVIDPNLFSKPKAKKLSIGFHLGYSPLYYNIDTKKSGFTNQITGGVGINYKIL